MIYWWLFNVWIGVMCLAEYSKDDGYFGNPHWFWWTWMTLATVGSFMMLIAECKKIGLLGKKP